MENKSLQEKPENCWNQSDREDIIKVLSVLIAVQKLYGRDASVKDIFAFYQMKLDGRYPASKVLSALDAYTDKKDDVPAPADLIALMDPPKTKISQAEFIHAKDQWAKEGYPSYSYYAVIVKEYEKENHEDRAKSDSVSDEKLLGVMRNSIKRIT